MGKEKTIRVSIVYPADPNGTIPGGIDTCIKDLIRWAPKDIQFSVFGATTDRETRPLRRWTKCKIGGQSFMFYPVIAMDNPERQSKIPVTVRFISALAWNMPRWDSDIFQFHRIEPSLAFLRYHVPMITFIHQNMEVLHNKSSDIRWKYTPWIYYKLEDFILPRFDSVYVVHEEAVRSYRRRYPGAARKINFLPTWMNPKIFFPVDLTERKRIARKLYSQYGISENKKLFISVGRLDRQKNPLRLIESFLIVAKEFPDAHLVVIGDGVLRSAVEKAIAKGHLSDRVTLIGLLPNHYVANWLRVADLMILSSDYEGMPRCVVEAMGCGLPVATTKVGEVHRIVSSGENGEVAEEKTSHALAQSILKCVYNLDRYRGGPCIKAASQYVPAAILEPVYKNYRDLVNGID